ncbi:autotransporter-associated beta strand repeat-containing protein [Aeoliella mucimassa]|uniref:Autotransporter-associated beta strand repeat protein n=1 Tax=Aeoliella mucimassa TaxID=2527972 RepID=A0A518AP23_9BACT|nr:BNR-4 repeat-containing protein [Aeoliella mucimassa]QDU56480.1 Autotransporter-associated beta strand repeat protein [Aeoliella mucimassa]
MSLYSARSAFMDLGRVLIVGLLCGVAAPALAANDVAGTLFTLTNSTTAPNGAWSWFQDERVVIDDSDPNNTLLMASSVSAGSGSESGDIDLLWMNLDTQQQGEYELHNQFQQDDHDSAAIYVRPDGRYLAMYAGHFLDGLTRWRVSTNPHDPTSWGAEQTLNNGDASTYNNIYYLPNDNNGAGRTYNFTRTDNWDPNVQISDDDGSTWTEVGKLLTQGTTGDRPYVRYGSDGNKIHFITTEEHPRQNQNSVYHGYVRDGVLYSTAGEVIDSNLFDASGAAPAALTPVFTNGSEFDGVTLTRAWTIDMEVDNTGNPVGILSARVNDSNQDHRFLYARFDGIEWQVHQMAAAGGYLYSSEDDYTGLASVDPDNPNVVYMSSDIDPRSGSTTNKYELYKGVTDDFGASWTWSAITENSTIDNVRPVVADWNGNETAVTWMRGTYTTYADWNTEIVGVQLSATDAKSLLWRGDASQATLWDLNTTANWDSGGDIHDVYLEGAEVAFGDSASSTTVHLASNVSPMGVAFNNSSQAYTLTGSGGIGGSGRLRVIGGGTVTLANGDNSYTGPTEIARGTLAISGEAKLSGSSHIHVMEQGVFDTTAVVGDAYVLDAQQLTIEGNVQGNVAATNASTVHLQAAHSLTGNLSVASGSLTTGTGTITGHLVAREGGTIQIGGQGMPALQTNQLVDNFDSYNNSTTTTIGANSSGDATNGVWLGVFDGTGAANVVDESGSNQSLDVFGIPDQGSGGWRGAQTDLTSSFDTDMSVADQSNTTLFFQFKAVSNTGTFDTMFGLTDSTANLDLNDAWSDFAVMPFLAGGGVGAADFKATTELGDQIAIENVVGDQWYNVWMVVDTTDNLFDIYVSTGTDDGVLAIENAIFRNGLGNADLTSFGIAGREAGHVRIDNLYRSDGVSITNPLSSPSVTQFVGETLLVTGDLTLETGGTVVFDIATSGSNDKLAVGGNLNAGGTLTLVHDAAAPALAAGDAFDLLDFATLDGVFDELSLPTLNASLRWNTSRLLTEGILSVEAGLVGDFNSDGIVNLADYTVWRDTLGSVGGGLAADANADLRIDMDDYLAWKANFGATMPAPRFDQSQVPEPSAWLLAISLVGVSWRAIRG